MTRAKRRNNDKTTVIWVLDESICQDKNKWSILEGDVKNLKELNLLSTKDAIISKTLDTTLSKGKIVITANKHPDNQGDYFKISPIQGLVKFSSDIKKQTERKIYLKKFQQMVKNKAKLLGAEVTLTKTCILYKKGSKIKNIKYKRYI